MSKKFGRKKNWLGKNNILFCTTGRVIVGNTALDKKDSSLTNLFFQPKSIAIVASVDAGLTPPTYKLKDITGKKIDFTWYGENLEKISPNKLTNYFQVDKVLKRRKNGKMAKNF